MSIRFQRVQDFRKSEAGLALQRERVEMLGKCVQLFGGSRVRNGESMKQWLSPLARETGVPLKVLEWCQYPERGIPDEIFPEFQSMVNTMLEANGEEWLGANGLRREDFDLSVLTYAERERRRGNTGRRRQFHGRVPSVKSTKSSAPPTVQALPELVKELIERHQIGGGTAVILLPRV